MKITTDFRGANIDIACILGENNIEYEYSDGDFTVFMLTPQNLDNDFLKLKNVFENMGEIARTDFETIQLPKTDRAMTIRDSIFAENEEIDIDKALNRICASPTVSCPPAIPIAVSGERITEKHIELFKKYNFDKILVVK